MEIYFSRAAASREPPCSVPAPRRYPTMSHPSPAIVPSTGFPANHTHDYQSLRISRTVSMNITSDKRLTVRSKDSLACIMSSISRSTSSAVFSCSSGLCVSMLLDNIKACMSKSVATASSSLLKSSSSSLKQTKGMRPIGEH